MRDLGNYGAVDYRVPPIVKFLRHHRVGRSMLGQFDPKLNVLPKAQQELWPLLSPIKNMSFVLYGGTAVALHLGHRISVDFDFFKAEPLDKKKIEETLSFVREASTLQEDENTLVISTSMPSGPVKVSFFGNLKLGRLNDPLQTKDKVLIVASLEDLLATKLKAILDRAEAKDYRDIAEMLSRSVSLESGLGAFSKMFRKDPALPLRAIGFFKDGDLPSLTSADQRLLRTKRDAVTDVPNVKLLDGLLPAN